MSKLEEIRDRHSKCTYEAQQKSIVDIQWLISEVDRLTALAESQKENER